MVIEVNKDIDRYQESVAMGLTARLCGGAGSPSDLSYNRGKLCYQGDNQGCGEPAGCKAFLPV